MNYLNVIREVRLTNKGYLNAEPPLFLQVPFNAFRRKVFVTVG